MPITYVDYTATAAQTDFAFSFPYLEDEHVIVQIDGSATTDFTIVTTPSTKIVLNVGATAGQVVRVSRVSQPDQNLVDFVNGSVLTESELDRAYLHNRYLAEESAEQNDVSLRVKEGAAGWDGLNKRLLNLANPVADQDAATKDYVDDVVGSVAVGTLPDDSVTYAKIQEVAANNVLLGNDNGTNQNIQELTAAEVRTVLNVEDGANNFSLADNAVTSAKISDTDDQFSVDDTSSQKTVIINNSLGDVDFIVKSTGNGNLIITDGANNAVGIGTTTNANFALTASNAAVGSSLVIYDPASSTEGGQININKAGITTPTGTEADGFVIDSYDTGATGNYGLPADTDVLRIIGTPGSGAAEKSIVITEDADLITNGDIKFKTAGTNNVGEAGIEAGEVHSQLLVLKDGVTAPSTFAGQAAIYVDSADGDLKIKFSDGTVKTIVTDT